MLRVALVNVPFADFNRPPLALAQLRSVIKRSLPGRAEATIFHLNLDFARLLGPPAYAIISSTVDAMLSGTGDWLFRAVAFPEVADNTPSYFRRYPKTFGPYQAQMQELLLKHRSRLSGYIDELIDTYQLDRFDVVGCASTFQQNVACFALARKLKDRRPEIVTVMGGPNCESEMGESIARNVAQVDFVFSGPALRSFPSFLERLSRGRRDECHDLHGVFSRERLARGGARAAGEVGEELDIDTDVELDYDDYFAALDEKLAGQPLHPHLLFETSRGCWWGQKAHCTFCGLNGQSMNYRAMAPEKALAQFDRLFKYASRVERFESVDNIMPKEYLTHVFPRLQSPKDVFYEVKADLSEEELGVLAKAGVRSVQPGIEALATSTLRIMRKGTSAAQNVRFLKGCVRHGVSPVWNLLVGFPGEGEESYRKYCKDVPLLVHLPPPSGVHPVRFDRFSPYFNQAQHYGLRLVPHPFYGFVYPFDAQSLQDIAYYFVNEDLEAPYLRSLLEWLGPMRERVAAWKARWASPQLRPELYLERRLGRHDRPR